CGIRALGRRCSGDAALSQFAKRAVVSIHRAASRRDIPFNNAFRVRDALTARLDGARRRVRNSRAKIQPVLRGMKPVTLPSSLYRDAGVYQDERKHIFGRSWLFLGHESQLAEPGAYIAVTLAGYPLLAVRGKDNVIRAFHNVCRHRAGPL